MINSVRTHSGRPAPRLSPRQKECLRGVLQLRSGKEIARELGISPHAVEKHLRICREKYGVATSAEAARLFALQEQGGEFPQCGVPDLAAGTAGGHRKSVSAAGIEAASVRPGDSHGALSADRPLTPLQTLLTIAAVSFVSIVGLLLLVACAEGVRRLVSN